MVLGNRDLAVLDTGRVRVVAPVLEVRVTRSPDAPDDCRSLPVDKCTGSRRPFVSLVENRRSLVVVLIST